MKSQHLLVLMLIGSCGYVCAQSRNSPVDAGSLRGKRIVNPLQPLDRQGLGWDSADQRFEPTSYSTQSGNANYCAPTSASSTNYTCNLVPALGAYGTGGLVITFKPDVTNTGGSAVNVNSLGARTIQKLSAGSLVALASGDLDSDAVYLLRYNGSVFVLDPGNSSGTGAPADASYVVVDVNGTLTNERVGTAGFGVTRVDGGPGGNLTFAADTSVMLSRATDQAGTGKYVRSTTGNDTYVGSVTPALTAYTTGMCLVLNPDTTNTGPATVNVDTLGAKSILKRAAAALSNGDLPANEPSTICYDGTQFILQGDGGGGSSLTLRNTVTWPLVGCNTGIEGGNFLWTAVSNISYQCNGNGGFANFSNSSSSVAFTTWELPANINTSGSTDLLLRCVQTDGGSGNAEFDVDVALATDGAAFSSLSYGTVVSSGSVAVGATSAYKTFQVTGINLNSAVAGNLIRIRVARDNTVGTNYANPVRCETVTVRYSIQ